MHRRWAIFAITSFNFFLSQFYRSSNAVIAPQLLQDLGLDTAGLGLMAGNLKDQKVLVLGFGPVGQNARKALLKTGCRVSVYDVDPGAYEMLSAASSRATDGKVQFMSDLEEALLSHELIVDATPAADLILAQHIKPNTIVSAPGMPLGLDRGARTAIGDRLLHDPLQIGVATMLVGALL